MTYTWLVLSVPAFPAWHAGANWYRCDLMRNPTYLYLNPGYRVTGSLRETAVPITCLSWWTNDPADVANANPEDCRQPHRGELVSNIRVPEELDWSDQDAAEREFFGPCSVDVARYMNIGGHEIPSSLSMWSFPSTAPLSRHQILCIAAAPEGKQIVGSLENIGDHEITFVDV